MLNKWHEGYIHYDHLCFAKYRDASRICIKLNFKRLK